MLGQSSYEEERVTWVHSSEGSRHDQAGTSLAKHEDGAGAAYHGRSLRSEDSFTSWPGSRWGEDEGPEAHGLLKEWTT